MIRFFKVLSILSKHIPYINCCKAEFPYLSYLFQGIFDTHNKIYLFPFITFVNKIIQTLARIL